MPRRIAGDPATYRGDRPWSVDWKSISSYGSRPQLIGSCMHIRRYCPDDLPGVLCLCEAEHWPSFSEDPPRANRALTAPGVTTMVAMENDRVVGFAQMQSDGELQAHLSVIAVDKDYRGRAIARELIGVALREAGGKRVDLLTDSAENFYSKLPHRRMSGFRLYPEMS